MSWHCRECRTGFNDFAPTCGKCGALNSFAQGAAPHAPQGWVTHQAVSKPIGEVPLDKLARVSTGTRELDRVLGGGLVPGGVYLFSADPGFGKTTLLTQTLADLTEADAIVVHPDGREEKTKAEGLYVTAEETEGQIRGRTRRVAPEASRFHLLVSGDVSRIEAEILRLKPDVLVLDSVQTLFTPGVDGAAGTVTQVRESAARIVSLCKDPNLEIAAFLVGHVIKDGSVAGPKTLEHIVDAVLEGTKEGSLRVIRASKNRFGDANEAAIFRMTPAGLRSVDNPVELSDGALDVPGTCLGLGMLGRRAVLVELQTLYSPIGSSNDKPRRYVRGLSDRRALMVIAVLRARCDLPILGELHASIAGGLNLGDDPGLDLPLALGIAGALRDEAMPESAAAMGEIGLAGELRKPDDWEARLKQARIMGISSTFGPTLSNDELGSVDFDPKAYAGFATVADCLESLGWLEERPKKKRARRKR